MILKEGRMMSKPVWLRITKGDTYPALSNLHVMLPHTVSQMTITDHNLLPHKRVWDRKYFILFIVLDSCQCFSGIITLLTVFQNTFEQVRYEVIGDGTAPVYFTVNTITGSITTTQSLSSQSAAIYYVRKSLSTYLSPLQAK